MRSSWDTPWETLSAAIRGFERFSEAADTRPFRLLSFADASASVAGEGGAASSSRVSVLSVCDFTRNAEVDFLMSRSDLGAEFEVFAAIRTSPDSPAVAADLETGIAFDVWAEGSAIELTCPDVFGGGNTSGEDIGLTAGAGCPES